MCHILFSRHIELKMIQSNSAAEPKTIGQSVRWAAIVSLRSCVGYFDCIVASQIDAGWPSCRRSNASHLTQVQQFHNFVIISFSMINRDFASTLAHVLYLRSSIRSCEYDSQRRHHRRTPFVTHSVMHNAHPMQTKLYSSESTILADSRSRHTSHTIQCVTYAFPVMDTGCGGKC